MTTTLSSDITLGEKYEDTVTGIQGVATVVSFYLHACERVTLEFVKDGEVKYESFDTPRLVAVQAPEVPLVTARTGGPGGREPRRPAKVTSRR